MRSWLFIKGDSSTQLIKAPIVGADALVIDLSQVPVDSAAPQVRASVASWFSMHNRQVVESVRFSRWLRIKPLDQAHWRDDLVVAMEGAPDGLILPKCSGPDQIKMLASELYEIEQRLGIGHNVTKIIPQIGETAGAALTLRDYIDDPHPRLAGFSWDADSLARSLGAQRTHTQYGDWCDTMSLVRANAVLLARTLGLMSIETPISDPRDEAAGLEAAKFAKQDGFTGMSAVHPRQVSQINIAFKPNPTELARATAIIGLFGENPTATVVRHKGIMVDKSGLEQAQQMLALS